MAVVSQTFRVYGRSRRTRRIVVAAAACTATLTLALAANAVRLRGSVAPGVRVNGIDVSGLTRAQAAARIRSILGARLNQPVTVTTDRGVVIITPAADGVRVDANAAAAAALTTDRLRNELLPYLWTTRIEAPIVIGPGATLPAAARAISVPAIDAQLFVRTDGSTRILPSRDGRGFVSSALLLAAGRAALNGENLIHLASTITAPLVTTSQAARAARRAAALLSMPVALRYGAVELANLTPRTLAPLLRATPDHHGSLALTFDQAGLNRLLASVNREVRTPARSAGYAVDGTTATVVAARDGLAVDIKATGNAILAAGVTHTATVVLGRVRPRRSTAQAEALGIRRALFPQPVTTDMGDSSPNRIWNVHLLARILQDTIVMPGASFDFNRAAGQRTVQRGFQEGQQIENGGLVPVIGGGVCQVATTLFDAAFYAGLPITARTNHSFYISHYPVGMDATVSWGGPELRFVNTLKHPIMIHFTYTDQTLSVQLYGQPEGVSVQQQTGPQTNPTQPGTQTVVDATLPVGARVTSVYGFGGFTVTVYRTVLRHGHVLFRDSFTSVYTPEDTVVKVGPTPKPPPVATTTTTGTSTATSAATTATNTTTTTTRPPTTTG
jgi:vancomycin resistance protein YoaR